MVQDTLLVDFAALPPDIGFNPSIGRFFVRSGAGKGQFVGRDAVLSLTRAAIADQSQQLIDLGDRLTDGKITLQDFQRESARLVRRLHVQQTAIAVGGLDKVTPAMWLATARRLKIQYKDGKDKETGKPFGLKWLAKDIQDGSVSPAQLRNRLGMYAQAAIGSYWGTLQQAQVGQGMTEGRRILADSDRACPDCVGFAGLGWVPIAKLVMPTQKCQCRSRCRCQIEYRGSTSNFAVPVGSIKTKNGI